MMVMMIVWLEFDGISAVSWQRNSVSHDLTSWKCLAARFDFIHLSLMPLLSGRRNFCTKLDETRRGKNLGGVIAQWRHAVAPLNETEHSSDHPTYPAHHDDDGVDDILKYIANCMALFFLCLVS